MSVKDLIGEAHYFEETVTPERIKHLLDNVESGTGKASIAEKIEGMKYLLAMMARGRDVSDFYPQVVRNVIVKAVEVKKLVYTYLVHHADANATCRELALLAINSFQRDLSDPNQLVRALALRVLCGIRVREIVQIQTMSVKKCATDSSPYVRKTAAHCVGKIYQIDPDTKPELVEIIDRLLADKTTAVLSSAVAAYEEVCPDAIEMLHTHYRKLCHLLADLDEWGQIVAINILQRYARTQFTNPEPVDAAAKKAANASKKAAKKTKGGKKKAFYSDDEASDSADDSEEEEDEDDGIDAPVLAEDHELLLKVSLPLLRSRNSGVVLAVAALHQYLGPRDRAIMGKVGRSLTRIMRNHREIQYIVLTNIVEFAKQTPDMFRKYIKDFFIAESEPAFVRRMKLEVLAALVTHDNASLILREFTRYVKDDDKDFVKDAIAAIVKIANALPDIADRCLRGLMALVGTDSEIVVAESVIAIRQLLQQHPQHDSLVSRLAKRLGTTTSPSARSAIVWILGEFQDKPRVAAMAPDALRILAKNFKSEASEVKYQIVNLAAKTALYQPDSKPVQLLLKYVLELARYDADYDLRDRARLLRHLMLGTAEITALAADAAEEAGAVIAVGAGTEAGVAGHDDADGTAAEAAETGATEGAAALGGEGTTDSEAAGPEGSAAAPATSAGAASASVSSPASVAAPVLTVAERVKGVLLASKPPPALEASLTAHGEPAYTFGSLSFMVGHAAKHYQPLPGWATEESNPKVRDAPKEESSKPKKKSARYASTDDEDESDEDEDSEEDSDEEESDEDDEDDEEEDDEDDEEDEEDEDEDDDDDDDEDEDDRPAARKPAAAKAVVRGEDDDEEDEDEEDDEDDD